MQTLAPRFGISDVALKKHCKRFNVPTPPRGYWAKVSAGEKLARAPLSKANERGEHVPVELLPDGAARQKQIELEPVEIQFYDDLRNCHRLATLARQTLTAAKPDVDGIRKPQRASKLNVRVSSKQMRRALLILNAVARCLEKAGVEVGAGTSVNLDGRTVSFTLIELVSTTRSQPDDFDLSVPYEFCHSRFVTTQVPNGRFQLCIDDRARYINSPGCWDWRDCGSYRVEDKLGHFVARLLELLRWQSCDGRRGVAH